MTRYKYDAIRKTDGKVFHSDTIEDIMDAGMATMEGTVKTALRSHPEAQGLSDDDIEIRMQRA